jgi:membrane protease YdiL (CAAX protease family)
VNSERIQAFSRALIFLGLVLVSTVMASGIASILGSLVFGESVDIGLGGELPTSVSAWWQLHFQNLISQAVGFGGAVWMARMIWNRAVPVGLVATPGSVAPLSLLLVFLFTLASGPIVGASYELNVALIPEGGAFESMFKPMEDMLEALTSFMVTAGGARRVVVILSVAALPAIFEELAFRGVLQPLLIKATGKAWVGIAIASVLFSAIHFQFYGFLPRVLLGLLFGWLAYRSGSILPGIVAHFFNNAAAAITLWFTGSMTEDLFAIDTWSVLLSAVLTAGLVLAYDRALKRRENLHF